MVCSADVHLLSLAIRNRGSVAGLASMCFCMLTIKAGMALEERYADVFR
jgi:hypothetical protein